MTPVTDTVIATITLPWPISTNALYVNGVDRRTGKTRRYLTAKARRWKEIATHQAWMQALIARVVVPAGPLAIALELRPPRRGMRLDPDNRTKIAQDCIATALGFDDSRIVDCRVTIGDTVDGGAVVVTLTSITGVDTS